MKEYFDEKIQMWREQDGSRICTFDNETIKVVAENCAEFATKRDKIYIHDIVVLLEKALEGVADRKDLSNNEIKDIKHIREMIKGL